MNIDSHLDLGPLPTADDSATMEVRSILALRGVLPPHLFRYRREEQPDAGVDGWLELLVKGNYTNLRSQVQLKSLAVSKLNADGSISYSVPVRNLNYLCYGPNPLYVLYIGDTGGLRYVWAHSELQRLNEEKPDWIAQESVTLRFADELDAEGVERIYDQIRRSGLLDRELQEALFRARTDDRVVISINRETLKCSDPDRLSRIICESGLALVAEGFANDILKAIPLLSDISRKNPSIRIACAYANFTLGRYHATQSEFAEAVQAGNLNGLERELMMYLRDAIDYHSGKIDLGEYRRRLDRSCEVSRGPLSISIRLNSLRYAIPAEKDSKKRGEILEELRSVVAEVDTGSFGDAFKLQAQVFLLYGEACDHILSFAHGLGQMWIRRALGKQASPESLLSRVRETWPEWDKSLRNALEKATELGQTILIADVLYTKAHVMFARLANSLAPLLAHGIEISVPAEVSDVPLTYIREAARCYQAAGNSEGNLRARMAEADMLEFIGEREAAHRIAEELRPLADVMGFGNHLARADEHLTGNTPLARLTLASAPKTEEEIDVQIAGSGDDELQRFAQASLDAMELPNERLSVVLRECESLRDIAAERISWCRHIELIQDLTHSASGRTAYQRDPERFCRCQKRGKQSLIGNPEWKIVIRAFKEAHCSGCQHRSPYVVQE